MRVRIAYGAREGGSLVGGDGPIVVIDALRMSATVIVACRLGLRVIPVRSVPEALALGREGAVTAGERHGAKIPALDLGNSPTALLRLEGILPRYLALTTTNGVPALLSVAEHPREVLIGSPLNLSALASYITTSSSSELGILIAGERGPEAEEDEMTASLLLEKLEERVPEELPGPVPPAELGRRFAETHSGRGLCAMGYGEDVELCSRVDRYPVVPRLIRTGSDLWIAAEEVDDA